MDRNHERIAQLISLLMQDKISAEEMAELNEWQQQYPEIKKWIAEKEIRSEEINDRYAHYLSENISRDWSRVEDKAKIISSGRRANAYKWMAAAAVLILGVLGVMWMQRNGAESSQTANLNMDSTIVSPGTQKAFLTLSDGQTIALGEQGIQTVREGDLVMKVEENTLDYANLNTRQVFMHKLSVPLGGTYHIQLNDGTNVWLNADSEMEFPSVFGEKERKVTLKGEAFFEVAKNKSKPFRVEVEGTTVEALGTAFNINTHLQKGMIKTILTSGKIRVSDEHQQKTISPGFAAISGDGKIEIEKADLEEALAWKDGYFYFTGKNLNEILDEVSRWYDVELKLETKVSGERYQGGVKRIESIGTVCKMLHDLTGYSVTLQNRTLIVK